MFASRLQLGGMPTTVFSAPFGLANDVRFGPREQADFSSALQILPHLVTGTPIDVPQESLTKSAVVKRYLTCLLAIYMPEQGVEEQLESAFECWNFYTDRPTLRPLPPTEPPVRKAKITGSSTRPGLVISE